MKRITTLLIILSLIPLYNKADAQVISSDSLALVDIYNAGDGANWTGVSNWLVSNVSEWEGVVVTGDRVTELYLIQINFGGNGGTLSPSIGNLTELTRFEIQDAPGLTGSIPAELWNCTGIGRLQIKYTGLTGGIPAGIESMVNAYELNFQQSYLGGEIPPELFQLPSLTKAYLHQSNFTGTVPSTLSDAAGLQRLYLHENKLVGPLPMENIADPSLAKVNLGGNFFTYDDVKPYHDSAATYAGFTDDYQFAREIVDTVVEHGSSFTINGTVTDAEAYAWFKDDETTPVSTSADLSFTDFELADEGTYTCKAQSSQVPNFDIRTVYNISDDIAGMERDSLALVDFYNVSGGDWDNTGTWLVGNVDTWTGVTVFEGRVTELTTEGFFPSGTVSPLLGKLSELEVLKLMGLEDGPVIADFNGSIPEEIWDLVNLEKLQIKFTNMTGGIPAGIESMDSLIEINFQQTYLEGEIPAELFELPSLQKAYLHQSNFTGAVPETVTGATGLTRLYLHDNKLEGPLPFVDLPNGQAKVNLTGNFFTYDDVKQYHDSAATFAGFTDDYQFAQEDMSYSLTEGDAVDFELYVKDGEAYAWFYNDEPAPISTDTLYSISSAARTDTGVYVCKVQNSQIANFDIRAIFAVDEVIAVPAPVSAASNEEGTTVSVTFDYEMADPSGEAAGFELMDDDVSIAVTSAANDGSDVNTIVLTLESAISGSESVLTLSYAPGTLQGSTGGLVAAFDDLAVTNNVITALNAPKLNISVYPNPVSDQVIIECASRIALIDISDLSGKSLIRKSVDDHSAILSVSDLNAGTYILSVKTDDQVSVQKLVIF